MTGPVEDEGMARACLTAAAEAGDAALGRLLRERPAAEVWAALRGGTLDRLLPATAEDRRGDRAERWRLRAERVEADRLLDRAAEAGARLVAPGDPEWPGRLDPLGDRRPYALWVRGRKDLRNSCLRSVAVVGSRAATAYGLHVASELGHALSVRAWTVVSGGAYGIDSAAHRGALAGGTPTVAVLACGPDRFYPRGNEALFGEIAEHGVLVTENAPGAAPTRYGFLVRNRLIAALTPGTVVVEAGLRSGALNTAHHAQELHRTVMAVPGPVTSALSAGCHRLLRDWQAVCVGGAAEVAEQLGSIGEELAASGGTVMACDGLDEEARRILDAVPERPGAGPAAVAAQAGTGLDTALRHLGLLAAGGFIERCPSGWRRRRNSEPP
ncbi:DNA-processing protein DprA [Nocardiopsis potens]|uniref:DNA-processing protein DprA n=1 Tax=Nocardiopsis potens TaxID=1246458 RepID=UPI00034993B8